MTVAMVIGLVTNKMTTDIRHLIVTSPCPSEIKMAAPAYLKKYYCTVHSQFVTNHAKYGLNVLASDSYGKLTVFR